MLKRLCGLLCAALVLLPSTYTLACTTGIVSGKYTADGRPLLFKQRDSEQADNVYVYSNSGKYAYIGVVPIGDKENRRVVYGHNEKGLAIMNSNSYNLEGPIQGKATKHNLIRLGLEGCATVDEFETMLRKLAPFAYGSNYGCLDATGACVYLECGCEGVKRYDADDPKVAPHGYIVRSNFGMSGDLKKGKGYPRYVVACELFEQAAREKRLDWRTLFSFSRSLRHGWTHMDLNDWMPECESSDCMMPFRDFIPRYITGSAVVYQGVKRGESPMLTTAWVSIAHPLTTVCIPLWFGQNHQMPACVQRRAGGDCLLVNWGNALKRYLFPIDYGEGRDYIMLSHLINAEQSGVLQQILPVEEQIIRKGEAYLEQFRKANAITEDYTDYYRWVDEYVDAEYRKIAQSHGLISTSKE